MNIERPLKGTRGRSHKLISKKYQNSHNNKCNSSGSWANKGPSTRSTGWGATFPTG